VTRHARPAGRATGRAALTVIRGGYGVMQLASPTVASGLLARTHLDNRGQAVARALGARQLAQALASGPEPSFPVLAVGVEIDLLHAASMLALALGRRRRPPALAGVLAAREAAHDPPPQRGNAAQELRQQWADRVAAACVPGYKARSGTSWNRARHDP
jgi:hypothetical protein